MASAAAVSGSVLALCLVVFCLLVATVEGSHCYSDEFECFGGRCIHYTSVCDGYYDCSFGDSSDETNCDTCSSREYRCSNGYCILLSQRCDGYNDCWDNSDEYCSTSGGSVAGVIVGVTILALCLLVVVVFAAVGGGSYRRSRRRRLMRTAPLVTIHSPPPPLEVSTAPVTYLPLPPSEQTPVIFTTTSGGYPPAQPDVANKDCPPPYSTVAGESINHTPSESEKFPPVTTTPGIPPHHNQPLANHPPPGAYHPASVFPPSQPAWTHPAYPPP